MFKLIDPHLHFFDLTKGDYHWLKPTNPPFWSDKHLIAKNFNQEDLQVNQELELSGYVHIEAGYDNQHFWREVEWLESNKSLPFRTVASADLTRSPELFTEDINKLKQYSSVVGVRHIFDEEALNLLNNPAVIKNLEQLAQRDLSFDLQMPFCDAESVDALLTHMSSLPHLNIIINHAGFPPLPHEPSWKVWQNNIKSVAKYPNVAVKCSGWEMKSRDYSMDWVAQVIAECLEAFGHDRVLLASNFPLCLFSKSYDSYWKSVLDISEENTQALLYDNACQWYKF
ncbi:amidohydrolase family protein [Vibrio sp.]|uniref:amidohydrolase family protein n=1 Tax=Vibrio sp. TaxID=678 RepID=UPI00311ED8F3